MVNPAHVTTATAIILALIASTLADVPLGCVRLKSVDKDRYLASASNRYDNQRRQLTLHDEGHDDTKWIMIQDGAGFRLNHDRYREDLYAAGDHYAYDGDRRRVFTWVQGGPIYQRSWDVYELGNNRYRLRNRHYGEYLYAASYPTEESIFTWRQKENHEGDNQQFIWEINRC